MAIVEVHTILNRVLYGLRFTEDEHPEILNPRVRWMNPIVLMTLSSVTAKRRDD